MNSNFKTGKLKRWNDDKGFGFIGSEENKRDIFIHISALKNMSRRPFIGDSIVYQINTDNNGQQRAVNAKIVGVTKAKVHSRHKYIKRKKANNGLFKLLTIVLILGMMVVFYEKYMKNSNIQKRANTSISSDTIQKQNSVSYSCEGKVYCSEMTSCEEAKYYQNHCFGTKMDGDGDGIPCEKQWCHW